MPLNEKQTRFAEEYLIDFNATQAAIRAGYSKKTAYAQAHQLLKKLEIREFLAIKRAAQSKVADVSATDVLIALKRIGFGDIRGLFHEDGTLKSIHELSDETASCVAGFEIAHSIRSGREHVTKVKRLDSLRALELLAKHFGILVEKVDHDGEITIKWKD